MIKQILHKVSFDKKLFQKELSKSLSWLKEPEQKRIKKWVKKKYPLQLLIK